jgi:hypothetical protein
MHALRLANILTPLIKNVDTAKLCLDVASVLSMQHLATLYNARHALLIVF